jgi:hypothetical protein
MAHRRSKLHRFPMDEDLGFGLSNILFMVFRFEWCWMHRASRRGNCTRATWTAGQRACSIGCDWHKHVWQVQEYLLKVRAASCNHFKRRYEHAKPKETTDLCRICGACINLAREGRVWRQRGSTKGNWWLFPGCHVSGSRCLRVCFGVVWIKLSIQACHIPTRLHLI